LPYNMVENTRPITVEKVTVTLDVSPSPPWIAGQTLTFVATVTRDGLPWAGTLVIFVLRDVDGVNIGSIGTATTNVEGKASLTWTIPWKIGDTTLPCHTLKFHATEQTSITVSNWVSGACAFPTRISILAPDSIAPGETFIITGKLEYESAEGVWSGLAGRTVSLFYNATHITDVTTETDGSYTASASIPETGTYTLKASFAGEGLAFARAFAVLGLPVEVSPELVNYATYALAMLPVLTVGGAIVYNELTKRR